MTVVPQDRPELMTWCRIMQVGPACPHPCGGCAVTKQSWTHDHWGNVERDPAGLCRECLA